MKVQTKQPEFSDLSNYSHRQIIKHVAAHSLRDLLALESTNRYFKRLVGDHVLPPGFVFRPSTVANLKKEVSTSHRSFPLRPETQQVWRDAARGSHGFRLPGGKEATLYALNLFLSEDAFAPQDVRTRYALWKRIGSN